MRFPLSWILAPVMRLILAAELWVLPRAKWRPTPRPVMGTAIVEGAQQRSPLLRVQNGTIDGQGIAMLAWPWSADCSGRWGLWHFFARCMNDIVATGYHERLVFYGGPSELPSFTVKWQPFLDALFTGGVYANPQLAPPGVFAPFVLCETRDTVKIANDALKEIYRERGFAAFNVTQGSGTVVHIQRTDTGKRAYRTLENDEVWAEAFGRHFKYVRCCDWHAPNSTREALVKMASADVVIGMHGAGLTHAYWMRPHGVLIDVHAETPTTTKAHWFFTSHGYQASYLGLSIGRHDDFSHSVVNATFANALVACVLDARRLVNASRPPVPDSCSAMPELVKAIIWTRPRHHKRHHRINSPGGR